MASHKNKNTYNVNDLVRASKKEHSSKPKIGYFEWIRRGGWKSFGKAIVVASVFGLCYNAVYNDLRDRPRRLAEKDAQTLFEQGVRPPKPINRAIIHEEKYEFGKSTIGFNPPKKTEPSDK